MNWARQCRSNQVYPRSIAEGIQKGDIFTDRGNSPRAVLFWHYCGFGYLTGNPDEGFLEMIRQELLCGVTDRRFLLITDDPVVIRFYEGRSEINISRRIEYQFVRFAGQAVNHAGQPTEQGGQITGYIRPEDEPTAVPAKEDFRIERIDRTLLSRIEGRIIPSFSWESDERFLKHGFGYVAIEK